MGEIGHFARGAMRTSKRLILSYILDWILIIAIAAVGAVFNQISASTKRPFVLQDPSLSFPYRRDTVSITVAAIVALLVPAAVMLLVCMIVVPGAGAPRGTPASLVWRRKLWEWNTAWMGLALSCATAFMLTEGLKDLAGKPRPHSIAVCNPDLSRIRENLVSTIGMVSDLPDSLLTYGSTVPLRVTAGICRNQDPHELRDAFASWPSGHSSFSFAGLLYFSFFLCAKFAVTIPFLNPISYRKQRQFAAMTFPAASNARNQGTPSTLAETQPEHSESTLAGNVHDSHAPRNQAAAPPIFLLIICFLPIGAAIFICVSRWFDYHHHGIDILSGAALGIFTSWFSFRYYHMPIRRGSGWSWGARSRGRAFWIGVGRENYVGDEGWEAKKFDGTAQHDRLKDVEMASGEGDEKAGLGVGGRVAGDGHGPVPGSRENDVLVKNHSIDDNGLRNNISANETTGGAGRYDVPVRQQALPPQQQQEQQQQYGQAV